MPLIKLVIIHEVFYQYNMLSNSGSIDHDWWYEYDILPSSQPILNPLGLTTFTVIFCLKVLFYALFLVFFKIKFCLLLIFDFLSIEFIFPSYVIKIFSEIRMVLIESKNIYINHTHSWARTGCSLDAYVSESPEHTGACSKPVVGLKHVIYLQLLNVSAVQ